MSIKLRNVEFKNRVFVASGTYSYGEEANEIIDVNKLGAVITKTITIEERLGNQPPRLFEIPSGLMNSIGLANVGIDKFITDKIPALEKFTTKIIANVAGFSSEEFGELVKRLDPFAVISAFELNLSCPNVKEGGQTFASNPDMVFEITKLCRAFTEKPIIVKLSPNVSNIAEIARGAELGGADAVSMINTVVGMVIDIKKKKPYFKNKVAGMSGPAVRPIGVAAVYNSFEKIKIPIIGLGGIDSFESSLQYFMAGASFIQIGTYNFVDVNKTLEIIEEIENYEKNQSLIEDIIGCAH